MKINSFKLESGGLSGASISYNELDLIGGTNYDSPVNKRCKAPVPQNLKDKIRSLKVFFLDMCGYWNRSWDDYIDYDNLVVIKQKNPDDGYSKMRELLQDVQITAVDFDGVGFSIQGTYETSFNGKVVNLKSPKIVAGDEYEQFHVISLILKEAFDMVKKYVSGDMKADPKQFVEDYLRSKGNSESEIKEQMEGMGEDDLIDYMVEKGRELGLIVTPEDEILEGIVAEREDGGEEEWEEEIVSTVVDTKDVPKQLDVEEEAEKAESTADAVKDVKEADEQGGVDLDAFDEEEDF